MTPHDALEALLKAYRRYYNVETEGVEPPFAAQAVFHSHDEQYFLVKRARLAEAEAHEYVFFAVGDAFTLEDAARLDACAWERGLAHVNPGPNHRSTDVVLILLGEHISKEAMEYIKKINRYQSYRFTFHGWSSMRAVALETSSMALAHNRRGRDLKDLLRNIKV